MGLGSGIRKKLFRIRGSKRHRIPDPDPKRCIALSPLLTFGKLIQVTGGVEHGAHQLRLRIINNSHDPSPLLTFGKLINITGGVALQRLVKHGAHQLRLRHLQVQLRSL
jgi:hypothetical protein